MLNGRVPPVGDPPAVCGSRQNGGAGDPLWPGQSPGPPASPAKEHHHHDLYPSPRRPTKGSPQAVACRNDHFVPADTFEPRPNSSLSSIFNIAVDLHRRVRGNRRTPGHTGAMSH